MTVLDTNVISELMRADGSPEVFQWVSSQLPTELFTTAISEAEIFYGIELISKGKRRDALLAAAEELFGGIFLHRVLAFDSAAARAFSLIQASRRKLGKPIRHADAQIAAITQIHGAALATRDVRDFANCDIRVVDPWHS